jgi:hypothetical protein
VPQTNKQFFESNDLDKKVSETIEKSMQEKLNERMVESHISLSELKPIQEVREAESNESTELDAN